MAALWEKLPWSKKPTKVEYRFQQSESDDSTLVEITSGEYTGVVYSYGMVKLKPESVIPILQTLYLMMAKETLLSCSQEKSKEEIMSNNKTK
jgi:hypothetical protein